jgi:hypothetical protein
MTRGPCVVQIEAQTHNREISCLSCTACSDLYAVGSRRTLVAPSSALSGTVVTPPYKADEYHRNEDEWAFEGER